MLWNENNRGHTIDAIIARCVQANNCNKKSNNAKLLFL